MYKCEKCDSRFETPKFIKEIHTQCPEQPCEFFVSCPYCNSLRIERTDTYD